MNARNIKRQHNLARWTPIIKACKSSGMTTKAWCKEHQVDIKQFYYWQRVVRETLCSQLEDDECLPTRLVHSLTPTFVPLKEQHTPQEVTRLSFQPDMVIRSGDIRIELTNDTSMKLLADVMKVMHHV